MTLLDCTVKYDPPRVELDVILDDEGINAVTFTRIDEGKGGLVVRSGAAVPVDVIYAHLVDWEVPLDTPVRYEVSQQSPPGDLLMGQGPFTVPSQGLTWLSDPAVPSRALRLDEVRTQRAQTRAQRAGVFHILDRARPVVVSARRSSWTGELEFHTATLAQRSTVHDIVSRGQVVLLRTPGDYGLGTLYLHVGDLGEERVSDLALDPTRRWVMPVTEIDRPAAFAYLTEGVRWVDIYDSYYNWQALKDTGKTWAQVVEGG